MAYIGREPIVGNYQVLDALSASGTADYTLQKSSTNFIPESANHLIVSLNGVIQKPGSSFTVAGAVLSFSSSLTSNDSIDFIIALGSVLDIGTPSDATVSNAKLAQDIISGETALTSEPDSTDEILLSDAGTLKRIDYSLISNTPAFSAKSSGATSLSNDTSTKILYGSEVLDTDGNYASSRFTPTTAGKYFIRGTFRINTATDCNGLKIGIYKNGSADRWHQQSNINYETVEIEGVIDMNGSSDYVEIYGAQDTGGTVTTVNDSTYENFEGYRITGA